MNSVTSSKSSHLTLRALIITFLIMFGFYLLAEMGLVQAGVMADASYISSVILALYAAATLHWLWLTRSLSVERQTLTSIEVAVDEDRDLPSSQVGRVGSFWLTLRKKPDSDISVLVGALGDELANRHALGHFLSDLLLKLGLVGTVVGSFSCFFPSARWIPSTPHSCKKCSPP